jgi:hypothetical protein
MARDYYMLPAGDYVSHRESPVEAANHGFLSSMPVKSREMLFHVISDQVYFLKANIDEINALLEERRSLARLLTDDIDQDMCRIRTEIYQLEHDTDSAERLSLEKQILELLKEKRQQKVSEWQDKVDLKRELRKTKKEFRTAMLDLWMVRFLS